MSWRLWANLTLWIAAALHVSGQSSNVTQCIPSYNWSVNNKGQTPCLVAAYLESACGVPTFVNGIPPTTHYLGPSFSEADPCRCSSVTYSLISACGGCQGRTFSNWTTWIAFCPTNELTRFPRGIPDETEVPLWAYLNITLTNNAFDPIAAQRNLSGAPPLPSSSSSSSTSQSSTASATPSFVPTQSAEESHRSNAGAIAGGVVGGLVLLAAVGLGLLWWIIRKRRNAVQKDLTFDSRALVSGPAMSQTTGSPPDGPSPVPFSQSLYDTSDLSTYPGSPVTSAVFTHVPGSTVPGSRRSMESVSPSLMQLGPPGPTLPRGFTGAAEV